MDKEKETEQPKEEGQMVAIQSEIRIGDLVLTSNSTDIQDLSSIALGVLMNKDVKLYLNGYERKKIMKGVG